MFTVFWGWQSALNDFHWDVCCILFAVAAATTTTRLRLSSKDDFLLWRRNCMHWPMADLSLSQWAHLLLPLVNGLLAFDSSEYQSHEDHKSTKNGKQDNSFIILFALSFFFLRSILVPLLWKIASNFMTICIYNYIEMGAGLLREQFFTVSQSPNYREESTATCTSSTEEESLFCASPQGLLMCQIWPESFGSCYMI